MSVFWQTAAYDYRRYTDNCGSTLGISGAYFTIIAGDTRSTSGYNINTRYAPKLFRIGGEGPENVGSTIVLSAVGFAADANALKERLDTIVKMYKYQHGKPMSVTACAQRLSHILYNKRFFPYYVHAILGGLDEEGKGALYSYDPVGSYEREYCRAAGAAASLIMPFLDNQVNFKNQYMPGSGTGHDLKQRIPEPLPRKDVEELVVDSFTSAVERHSKLLSIRDEEYVLTVSQLRLVTACRSWSSQRTALRSSICLSRWIRRAIPEPCWGGLFGVDVANEAFPAIHVHGR